MRIEKAVFSIAALALTSAAALAQNPVPVIDASQNAGSAVTQPANRAGVANTQGVTTTTRIATTRPAYAPSATGDMAYQMQILQQEVQELRGLIEEQAYELQQMRDEQRDRYLDLDRRVSAIGQGGGTSIAAPVATSPSANSVTATAAPSTSTSSDQQGEYQSAFNLIRDKKYDAAIVALEQFSLNYPRGEYTANAYYWLGEVHLVKADYDSALSAFGALLNQFPQHRKVPDAKFKLGKAYRELGEAARSRQLLTEVVEQHAGSSAAKLAETELRKF